MSFWKEFAIGDLFERSKTHLIKTPAKFLKSSESKNDSFPIANVTASSYNNGISCWLEDAGEVKDKKKVGFLTIVDETNPGVCFYQKDFFVSNSLTSFLVVKSQTLKRLLDSNVRYYDFIGKTIELALRNRVHGWTIGTSAKRTRSISFDFDRELILLPVIACSESEAVWHDDDGTPITLDVNKISYLLSEAKKASEEKAKEQSKAQKKLLNIQLEQNKNAISSFNYKPNNAGFWKEFAIGDIFSKSSAHKISAKMKELKTSDNKNDVFCIANVTASACNNGIACWLEDKGEVFFNKKTGFITMSQDGSGAGAAFFQKDFFVSTGANAMLIIRNDRLKKKADSNDDVYSFLASEITVCLKNRLHGYLYKVSNDFDRELILLPVIACSESEAVWHDDDGTPITLDVNKISYLLKRAEDAKKQKALAEREVKAKKIKSEIDDNNRALSNLGYKKKDGQFWKSFSLESLFSRSKNHLIKVPAKFVESSDVKNELFSVANVTASGFNNGIVCYLKNEGDVLLKKQNRLITIATDAAYAGTAFFQKNDFVSTGHSDILLFKNEKLSLFKDDVFYFISSVLTASLRNRTHGFLRSISSDFDRELILLPVIACSESEAVWHDDDGTPITLDVDKISYLLLKGKEKKLEEELSKVSA
jgi:hypothetical protein